jgi:large subunit ribosomal protein L6
MSRIGKHPVVVPKDVTVQVNGQTVTAKGKLGSSSVTLAGDVSATLEDGKVTVLPKDKSARSRSMWGVSRTQVDNLVQGVTKGFTVNLEINGVGYRAAVQGKVLNLQLGFSHEVAYPIPEGIAIKCDKPTSLTITGYDRQRVGQVAAEIRSYRSPEPYKGKGVKYADEVILRKEGKKK